MHGMQRGNQKVPLDSHEYRQIDTLKSKAYCHHNDTHACMCIGEMNCSLPHTVCSIPHTTHHSPNIADNVSHTTHHSKEWLEFFFNFPQE